MMYYGTDGNGHKYKAYGTVMDPDGDLVTVVVKDGRIQVVRGFRKEGSPVIGRTIAVDPSGYYHTLYGLSVREDQVYITLCEENCFYTVSAVGYSFVHAEEC